jgi:hypothetical protein
MAYLGPPPSQKLATPTSQYFSGNGSATAFTLNRPVNVAEDLNVFVNNVAQQPGSGKSYTATGTTLTFDAAPDAGTNNVYVVYRGLSEGTLRLEQDPNSGITATTGTFSGITATTGTFSGDLTVDTTTLYVDSTNNRVGIGTTSVAYKMAIFENGSNFLQFSSTGDAVAGHLIGRSASKNLRVQNSENADTEFYTNNIERMKIDSSGRVTMPYQPFALVDFGGGGYVSTSGILPFDNIAQNQGNHYNTSTYKFTCPVSGVYRVSGKIITQNNNDLGHFNLFLNDVQTMRSYTVYRGWGGDFTIYCAANDTLHLTIDAAQVYYNNGSNRYSWATYYLLG